MPDNNQAVEDSLSAIIRNDNKLYSGDIEHYAQAVFNHAQNLQLGYHNFRHMFHVMRLCYLACVFYKDKDKLTGLEMRDLLIAALFHDYNHSGMQGDDDLNIERAIRGLRKHIIAYDAPRIDHIIAIIRATEYPHTTSSRELDLCGKILRDADACQVFSDAWIQQILFGLAGEWRKTPLQVLLAQETFARSLALETEWARETFPRSLIEAKVKEIRDLLQIFKVK